jgi:hypothetical protein
MIATPDKLGPEWRAVAALSDELKYAWLSEHFADVALLGESERRQHLRELIEEAHVLSEERRTALIRAGLFALLDLKDIDSRVIAGSWREIMERVPDRVADAHRESLYTAAGHISSRDRRRLGEIWPRIFAEDLARSA